MSENLLIVFVKNAKLGHVKTRLAQTIGSEAALTIYKELIRTTQKATKQTQAEVHIYFSETVETSNWSASKLAIQHGSDLGARMRHAFLDSFDQGYKRVVLIGSDLPDITSAIINQAFDYLQTSEAVIGPAEDGGYYLIGLSKMQTTIFEDMPWSESDLFQKTVDLLWQHQISFETLETLNDIDTFEDLEASHFYQSNPDLQQKIKVLL